ncbi:MAG: ribbon-helix-helix protein, CopG family [Desulfuromonadales bacterium]|nr:ribbon-helix-helix protein, CopG family [Desulfuromonadales bacterium]NIS42943.1 ribbon-helix-helix protein, CopG family [Desulfuromonadales bacterium]
MGKSVENPKKFIISCRVDDKEMDVLQSLAQERGVSISTLLRNSLTLLENNPGAHPSHA